MSQAAPAPEEDDEIDPLDAFMNELQAEEKPKKDAVMADATNIKVENGAGKLVDLLVVLLQMSCMCLLWHLPYAY